MGKLIEEASLRDRIEIFKDRSEAGCLLAEKLVEYKNSDTIVFGIPSGGVPVASEIANALKLPLDLIIVRKIQIPFNPEAGFGAVGPEGEIILNERLLAQLGLTQKKTREQIEKTMDVIKKRNQLFRQGRPYPIMENKNIIVVDDGLASGYTMLASIKFIRKRDPLKIIVAVPTGSTGTVDFVLTVVDELVCLNVRSRYPFAVADAYKNWYDLSDKEVLDIIKNQ